MKGRGEVAFEEAVVAFGVPLSSPCFVGSIAVVVRTVMITICIAVGVTGSAAQDSASGR